MATVEEVAAFIASDAGALIRRDVRAAPRATRQYGPDMPVADVVAKGNVFAWFDFIEQHPHVSWVDSVVADGDEYEMHCPNGVILVVSPMVDQHHFRITKKWLLERDVAIVQTELVRIHEAVTRGGRPKEPEPKPFQAAFVYGWNGKTQLPHTAGAIAADSESIALTTFPEFDHFGDTLQNWINAARERGAEPMGIFDHLQSRSGPMESYSKPFAVSAPNADAAAAIALSKAKHTPDSSG